MGEPIQRVQLRGILRVHCRLLRSGSDTRGKGCLGGAVCMVERVRLCPVSLSIIIKCHLRRVFPMSATTRAAARNSARRSSLAILRDQRKAIRSARIPA